MGNFISFNKPYLFVDKPIYPILYHNGKKIHANDYLLSNEIDSTFDVTFLNFGWKILSERENSKKKSKIDLR